MFIATLLADGAENSVPTTSCLTLMLLPDWFTVILV